LEGITIKIIAANAPGPRGKLADAELHFTAGPLQGMKLAGFSIWERRDGVEPTVTFPSRQYTVNRERRSFSFLRPVNDATTQESVRKLVLEEFAAVQHQTAAAAPTS
jgi:hypothetical protein